MGGDYARGTIFSIGTDGTGFTLLHEFAGGVDDGYLPSGTPTLSGTVLYGMTTLGGDLDYGVIFSIHTDGSGFTLLHEFAGGGDDGRTPADDGASDLLLYGDLLYGMTQSGGDSNAGVIFSIHTDGTGFTLLHEFAGGINDGGWPSGGLTVSSGILYGMTTYGGDDNYGTIFSLPAVGGVITLLHEFDGPSGRIPFGSLTLINNKLFGLTAYGGTGDGVAFSIGADGSGFTVLHIFDNFEDEEPVWGSLSAVGDRLYGMANDGGEYGEGAIFTLKLDGSGYSVIHYFRGYYYGDGNEPYGSTPLIDGDVMYGMTQYGGNYTTWKGTIFSPPPPDFNAPSVTIVPLAPDPTNDRTPVLDGLVEDAEGTIVSVECQVDSPVGIWNSCDALDGVFDEGSEEYACSVNSALDEGPHTVYIRATDSNGNTTSGDLLAIDTFIVDTEPPEFPVDAVGANVSIVPGTSVAVNVPRPQFVGLTEPYAHVRIEIYSSVIVGETDANGTGNWSWTPLQDIPAGTHRVVAVARDLAGNETTGEFTLTVNTGLAETGMGVMSFVLIGVGTLAIVRRKRNVT